MMESHKNGTFLGSQTKSAFEGAIQEIERVSCVRFVNRTNEIDFVRVISGDG